MDAVGDQDESPMHMMEAQAITEEEKEESEPERPESEQDEPSSEDKENDKPKSESRSHKNGGHSKITHSMRQVNDDREYVGAKE